MLAPLRPLFAAINTPQAPPDGLSPVALRERAHLALRDHIAGFYADEPPLANERDHAVAVRGGSITVRLYSPGDGRDPLPCHVYLHGGGFWAGTLDHFDALCRAVARDANSVVAAVDYRLAPEHKFPTATEDVYAAFVWVLEHAGALGIDPLRVSVGGVSAGGNLAAVLCLMARDRGLAPPVLQVLEVPVTDLSDWTSLVIPDEGLALPSGKDRYCEYYLENDAQAKLPYVSPLLALDLAGLPAALVLCAEYDPLAAEGKAYAERLAAAGVATEYRLSEGQFHGAQPMAKLIPQEATAYHATIVAALRQAFGTSGE